MTTANPAEAAERAGRFLTACAMLDTAEAWADASVVWAARLTRASRALLAFSALRSLPEADRAKVARHAVAAAGRPLPPFLAPLPEARRWAEFATRDELRAYGLAAFEAMRPADRAGLLGHLAGRAAA